MASSAPSGGDAAKYEPAWEANWEESERFAGGNQNHTCVAAGTHAPNSLILHGCGFAWQTMFRPIVWLMQGESGNKLESKSDVHIHVVLNHQPPCQSEQHGLRNGSPNPARM